MENTLTFDTSSFSTAYENRKIPELMIVHAIHETSEGVKELIAKYFFGCSDPEHLLDMFIAEEEKSLCADFFVINALFYGMEVADLSTDDIFKVLTMPRQYKAAFQIAQNKNKNIPSKEDLEDMFFME